MNEAIKKLWVEALRSGDYEQGKELLRSGDSFCCLGVLCDLHLKENGGAWSTSDDGMHYHESNVELPISVALWADTVPCPFAKTGIGTCDSLANINDSGKTFDEIATLIEDSL